MTPLELALAIDGGCCVEDALPFIAKYRESVIRECAKAMGDSGEYYTERGERWLLNHFDFYQREEAK